jgi:dihydrofolate synthase/folylpolyglutamate synthase
MDAAYSRVLQDLYARQTRRGLKLGLERVRALLDACGAPDRSYQSVLVAGTNGKGSTCAFVEALLRVSGKRTAFYSSPHLSRFTERLRVDGVEASRADVVDLYQHALAASGRVGVDPTFFELTTVMALLHFARQHVEWAVLEVGMGGRLDATNATTPVVCGITPVDFDHMAFLGNTLGAIAHEKAGILRAGIPAWVAVQQPEAADVIQRDARAVGAPVTFLSPADALDDELGLAGEHQRHNAALAVALVNATGVALSDGERRAALRTTRWPGRLEWVGRTLLDGAHNPHGARALGRAVAAGTQRRPWVWMLAASGDRDVTGLVRAQLDAGGQVPDAVVCTQPRVSTGVPAQRVAEMVRVAGIPDVMVEADLERAMAVAQTRAGADGAVLVWGSLYALGQTRALLLGEAFDDVALSG